MLEIYKKTGNSMNTNIKNFVPREIIVKRIHTKISYKENQEIKTRVEEKVNITKKINETKKILMNNIAQQKIQELEKYFKEN